MRGPPALGNQAHSSPLKLGLSSHFSKRISVLHGKIPQPIRIERNSLLLAMRAWIIGTEDRNEPSQTIYAL
jgi:hypothetical protein